MSSYAQELFHGFLKKPPEYAPPPSPKGALPELDDLKPTLSSVKLHRHGNELAVVVEGSNLWFSYQISLYDTQRISIPGDESNGTSIQYNIPGNQEDKVEVDSGMVKVFLQTRFSSKFVKQHVLVHKKVIFMIYCIGLFRCLYYLCLPVCPTYAPIQRYSVSTRQRQLAVLTPSQLIELAYLSALLEQFPFSKSQPISHKVEVIKTFLEKVVRVVPLESITHAIAYSPYQLAAFCTKALLASQIELPASALMYEGLGDAVLHLQSGTVSAIAAWEKADAKLLSMLPFLAPTDVAHSYIDRSLPQTRLQVSAYGVSISEPIESSEIIAKEHLSDEDFQKLHTRSFNILDELKLKEKIRVICGASIEHLYCTTSRSTSQQKQGIFVSPLDVLRQGNSALAHLAKELMSATEKHTSTKSNAKMLQTVNDIRKKDLAICAALLGGFMEQQKLIIPLVKSRSDQSRALAVSGPASVGVWALFSLKYEDIHPILSQRHGNQLLVRIENYIKAIFSREVMFQSKDERYAAKLQFIVQGLEKTVTCNSQYVSYSLERQLMEICKERNIDSETSLDDLEKKWGGLFKENILSLVARSHRPLIARWLKWALMVHNLREKLAEYTAVGVVGLVNSGKSMLVSSLFKIPVTLFVLRTCSFPSSCTYPSPLNHVLLCIRTCTYSSLPACNSIYSSDPSGHNRGQEDHSALHVQPGADGGGSGCGGLPRSG